MAKQVKIKIHTIKDGMKEETVKTSFILGGLALTEKVNGRNRSNRKKWMLTHTESGVAMPAWRLFGSLVWGRRSNPTAKETIAQLKFLALPDLSKCDQVEASAILQEKLPA